MKHIKNRFSFTMINWRLLGSIVAMLLAIFSASSNARAQDDYLPISVDDERVIILSSFGERAAFSPKGDRIAFIGQAYGDAYEIEISTRKIRNLTSHIPHQGILRIQYLSDGNLLATAPRIHTGPESRVNLEMWFLDKSLETGLQPLSEKPFEGIAISRLQNLIAWTTFDPPISLKPGESWVTAFSGESKARYYLGEIVYKNGRAQVVNKQEILQQRPDECHFIEPQDFRDNDRELTFTCLSLANTPDTAPLVSIMGYRFDSREYLTYRSVPGEYNEIEGVSPDGKWAATECGAQDTPGLLDICRLELKPDGRFERLVIGTSPGTSRLVGNPVVDPVEGRRVAFQLDDDEVGESGEGLGIYLIEIPVRASW